MIGQSGVNHGLLMRHVTSTMEQGRYRHTREVLYSILVDYQLIDSMYLFTSVWFAVIVTALESPTQGNVEYFLQPADSLVGYLCDQSGLWPLWLAIYKDQLDAYDSE